MSQILQPSAQLEQLLQRYEAYFTVQRELCCGGQPFAAFAEFHSRSEKYVLVKRAQLWAAENHEYSYFVLADQLDEEMVRRFGQAALADAKTRIQPHSEHMYSYVSLIFISDRIQEAAARLVQKTEYRKDFLLSIHGWMELRLVAYECASGRCLHNRRGKNLVALVEKNDQKNQKKKGVVL